jgi:hypothetical protein
MSGAIHPLPNYAFIAWCLVKAQGQLYLYLYLEFGGKNGKGVSVSHTSWKKDGEWRYSSAHSVPRYSIEISSAFLPLYLLRKNPRGIHLIGGWAAPRDGLDAVVKRKNTCYCGELNLVRRVRILVTILTLLLRLSLEFGKLSKKDCLVVYGRWIKW